MANDDILTDDYVGGLLSQEANDCSLKYSAMGMDAFRSDKKPANLPKPNKRFLRHIIKDTDTHNKNLLAKEAAESKARLKDLERTEEVKRLKKNPNTRDIRKRQMGDIHAILGGGGRKRRRKDDEGEDGDEDRSSSTRRSEKRGGSERHSLRKESDSQRGSDLFGERQRDDQRRHGRLDDEAADNSEEGAGRSRRREHTSERRRRSRSPRDSDGRRRRTHRQRSDSSSPHRRRRGSGSRKERREGRGNDEVRASRHRDQHQNSRSNRRLAEEDAKDSEEPRNSELSDNMDEDIGPQPLPKYRGRGAVAAMAGIDRRFSDSYDPSKDVLGDEDAPGSWGSAVESFRAAQKLKQSQARPADAAVSSTALGTEGGKKTGVDVTWSKTGEAREWDLGKDGES